MEEIKRISAILEESKDTKTILSALNELKNVKPSKEILIETKIGHKINYLRKHDDAAIKNLARLIFKEWKSFYKQRRGREIIEVRSDAKSELTRMKARKLLADSLDKEVVYFAYLLKNGQSFSLLSHFCMGTLCKSQEKGK